ncbi:HEAT repeat domain-containing protein [Candidatus Leptofilum sp.]|uniref:HEAT repeat domain-containing protein n=1 Tax=Candidatus Leptofilum sp. TaxID=3241576 RepID=UPI003B59C626
MNMIKEHKEEQPIEVVLNEIFTADPLPIAQLYRLSDMPDEGAEQFWQSWVSVSDERRQAIVRHLADICEDNFVVDFSPIFVSALEDRLPGVRIAALDGLWDSTDLNLIAPLTKMMKSDPDEKVRVAAAGSLGHYVLLAEWGQLPESILPELVGTMLAAYENVETAVPVQRVLLEGLGAADHPRIGTLIAEAYENGDQAMQLSAVFAMGNSADRRWTVTILGEMESPYEEMRAEAARAAGAIGNSDFVPQLAALAYDEDLAVQTAAVTALGQIGGDEVQRILADMLDDSEVEENEELLEVVEAAMEEAAMMAGDFDFADFPYGDPIDNL